TYDEVAVRILDLNGGADMRITGTAVAIDLWLWGRGGAGALEVDGDSSLVERVREAAVHATQ
ncbi:MAG: hypothetical protein KJN63_12165, partial [Acidimicrobiia bacterium]|nr:hypothetical protein [Acidimicrobiia bacterium]